MAAPITHLVLAEMIRTLHFPDLPQADFLVGTSFPDVRYLGIIDRDTTHFSGTPLAWADLQRTPPFLAGAKLHVMIDAVREVYMSFNYQYQASPPSIVEVNALKLLEDELLYEKLATWADRQSLFSTIPYDAIPFAINRSDVAYWYMLLSRYISAKPSNETRAAFLCSLPKLDRILVGSINDAITHMKRDQETMRIVAGFSEAVDSLLRESF